LTPASLGLRGDVGGVNLATDGAGVERQLGVFRLELFQALRQFGAVLVSLLEISQQHRVAEQTAALLQAVVVDAQRITDLLRSRQRISLLHMHTRTHTLTQIFEEQFSEESFPVSEA